MGLSTQQTEMRRMADEAMNTLLVIVVIMANCDESEKTCE
jgi:hypothetical protein